jgi:hypothetical protein
MALVQRRDRVAAVVLRAVLFAAAYLACAGASATAELAVAIFAGTAAAGLAAALGLSARPYAARPSDFARRLPGIVASILHDAARLTAAFARLAAGGERTSGELVTRAFDPGEGTPEARSRRGFVLAAVALAPNTVPIAVDYENGRLLVHRLVPGPEPKDRLWPI